MARGSLYPPLIDGLEGGADSGGPGTRVVSSGHRVLCLRAGLKKAKDRQTPVYTHPAMAQFAITRSAAPSPEGGDSIAQGKRGGVSRHAHALGLVVHGKTP